MNKNRIWEYKYVEYKEYPNIEQLNHEGKQGWELIQIDKYLIDKGDAQLSLESPEFSHLAVFKRLIGNF